MWRTWRSQADHHGSLLALQEAVETHMLTIFGSALRASCPSSDVFIVAMTMVTIVRQSIGNVEAGSLLLGSKPDDRRFGPAHHLFLVVPLTEEVHRRQGQKQVCMCQ